MNKSALNLLPFSRRFGRTLGLLALVFASLGGCTSQEFDPTGGETHFLRLCDDQGDACGDTLSCVCGVCTVACEDEKACAGLAGAMCLAQRGSSCEATEGTQVCEVACSADPDCTVVSAHHRCEDGACRADPEPVVDGQGGASSATATDELPAEECAKDQVLANEVLLLGDSFFATSHQITAYLENLARDAGAIEVGERYRDSSRLLNNALALNGNGILSQYESSVAEAAAHVVITNGGGADVLLGSCDEVSSDCALIADAANAFDDLLSRLAEDGVREVIYVSYPNPEAAQVLEKMNSLRPLLEDICESAPLPCHFLDLRPTFEGKYQDYILEDGLNPTAQGSEATAQAIWSLMQEQCIAQ